MRAAPKRASSGGTSMIDERISSGRRWPCASNAVSRWWIRSMLRPQSTSTALPMARKKSRILRTSVISGTPCRRTGSRVSKVAQRMGRTAFLFAEGRMRPVSGLPP